MKTGGHDLGRTRREPVDEHDQRHIGQQPTRRRRLWLELPIGCPGRDDHTFVDKQITHVDGGVEQATAVAPQVDHDATHAVGGAPCRHGLEDDPHLVGGLLTKMHDADEGHAGLAFDPPVPRTVGEPAVTTNTLQRHPLAGERHGAAGRRHCCRSSRVKRGHFISRWRCHADYHDRAWCAAEVGHDIVERQPCRRAAIDRFDHVTSSDLGLPGG